MVYEHQLSRHKVLGILLQQLIFRTKQMKHRTSYITQHKMKGKLGRPNGTEVICTSQENHNSLADTAN